MGKVNSLSHQYNYAEPPYFINELQEKIFIKFQKKNVKDLLYVK
jgi:hypothetical protein